MTPEGKIEAYLRRRVLETGGRIRKLSWIGRRGAPDRLIWWRGPWGPLLAFVELKAPGKKATPQQAREHDRLRADGFTVLVVDSLEGAEAFIASKGQDL